jgi:hypothetical protein
MTITREQKIAIKRLYDRASLDVSYLQFRRTVKRGYNCLMVEWCGMWVGIEKDGYTHS